MHHKVLCGHDSRSAEVRIRKGTELDVADIVIEDLNLGETTVVMFQHGAEPCFISRARLAWLIRGAGLGGHEGFVSDKKMPILADSAQITQERISEFIAVHNRIVIAVLLMVTDGLDHVRRHIGIHVILGQPLADGINRFLPSGFIQSNVVKFRSGRYGTDANPLYPWWCSAGKLQDSVGIDVVSAPVNKK